jgi:monofunctional biosynthetic peptidoglycan transglycosylase
MVLGALFLTTLIVSTIMVFRFVPLPTTAFMLESDVKPVDYRWQPWSRIAGDAALAVVAAEDQKFPDHWGFDFAAIDEAREHNQTHRHIRGASTISQQTAKNLFLWSGKSYFRKGLEAGFTLLLEGLWPKRRILEVYLNTAQFGPGIFGVEAAAQHYFGHSAATLSTEEAARLAAVLPNPEKLRVNGDSAYLTERTGQILDQMRQLGRGYLAKLNEHN